MHPFRFRGKYTTNNKNPVGNKPSQSRFLREPYDDIDSTGSVTLGVLFIQVSMQK